MGGAYEYTQDNKRQSNRTNWCSSNQYKTSSNLIKDKQAMGTVKEKIEEERKEEGNAVIVMRMRTTCKSKGHASTMQAMDEPARMDMDKRRESCFSKR